MASKGNNLSAVNYDTRAQLADLVKKRAELSENLKSIETKIYNLETKYLEESLHYGNIIKGWEKYLTTNRNVPTIHDKRTTRKFKDSDRLFSNSSITNLHLRDREDVSLDNENDSNMNDGDSGYTNSADEAVVNSKQSKNNQNKPKKISKIKKRSTQDE